MTAAVALVLAVSVPSLCFLRLQGTHTLTFNTPDMYGVYTLRLTHTRPCFTVINETTTMVVRSRRTEERQKFSVSSIPYYLAALMTVVGFLVLLPVLMYST